MSQLRGLGQAFPALAASSGTSMASVGRTRRNPPTQLRATAIQRCQSSASTGIAGGGHPPESPSATALPSTSQSRWQNRFASGADSSHPEAACSGGLAAATTATPGGSSRSPTVRSSTTRSNAACTAGGAVEISSKNKTPPPAAARRWAHLGGAKSTRAVPCRRG